MTGSRSSILAISALFGIFFIINCSVYICKAHFFKTYRNDWDVYSRILYDCISRKGAFSLFNSSYYVSGWGGSNTILSRFKFPEVQVVNLPNIRNYNHNILVSDSESFN